MATRSRNFGWKPAPRKPVTKASLLTEWRGYLRGLRVQDERSAVTRDVRSYVVCINLCNAMIAWLSGKGDSPTEEAILAAMRRPQQEPRFYGAMALAALAMFDADGPDTLIRVFREATLWACQSIIVHVRRPVPGAVLNRLIVEAARHKLPDVRRWAIQYAYHNAIPSFDRLMARRRRLETDKDALRYIEQYVSLWRIGYDASYSPKERVWRLRFHWGEGLATVDVPKAVVDEMGIPAAVECGRAVFSMTGLPYPWDEILSAWKGDPGNGGRASDRGHLPARSVR